MDKLRKPRLLLPLLFLAASGSACASIGSWLPLLASAPWLVAIAWFGSRDTGPDREFPSAAEVARGRLWVS